MLGLYYSIYNIVTELYIYKYKTNANKSYVCVYK